MRPARDASRDGPMEIRGRRRLTSPRLPRGISFDYQFGSRGRAPGGRKTVKPSLVIALAAGIALQPLQPRSCRRRRRRHRDALSRSALLDPAVGTRVITAEDIAAARRARSRNCSRAARRRPRPRQERLAEPAARPARLRHHRRPEHAGAARRRAGQPDRPQPAAPMSIPLNAIERIEILAGGGAVPYGSGATGGTINIITRGPRRGEKSGAVYAGAGSYASDEARANLNAAGDDSACRSARSHEGGDGYRRNNRLRQDSIAGDLRLFGDRSGLAMKVRRRRAAPGTAGSARRKSARLRSARGDDPSDWSAQNGGYVTLQGRTDIGRVELAADLGHRDQRSAATYRSLASYLDIKTRSTTFSPRLRWTGAPGTSTRAWSPVSISRTGTTTAASPGAPQPSPTRSRAPTASQNSRAIYVQGNVMVRAATKLSVGLRSQQVRNELGNSFGGAGVPQDQTRTVSAEEFGVHHATHRTLGRIRQAGNELPLRDGGRERLHRERRVARAAESAPGRGGDRIPRKRGAGSRHVLCHQSR